MIVFENSLILFHFTLKPFQIWIKAVHIFTSDVLFFEPGMS